jgi:hypothetical protein
VEVAWLEDTSYPILERLSVSLTRADLEAVRVQKATMTRLTERVRIVRQEVMQAWEMPKVFGASKSPHASPAWQRCTTWVGGHVT